MGADIAAGNHEEKGYWALFVILKIINKKFIIFKKKKKLFFSKKKSDKIKINKISPNRLVKKVIKLLFNVFQFLKKLTKIKEEIPKPSHPKNIIIKLFLLIKINIHKIKIINQKI